MLFALVLSTMAFGQYTGEIIYDFTDGTIITNQQSADTKLTLGGAYNHHGSTYGLNLKVDQTISIQVDGSATIRFLGSQHSSLDVKGTAIDDGDLGTQVGAVTNDLSDSFDFVYSGTATTLTFTTVAASGNDLYLPKITVIPAQDGGAATGADLNIAYYFDLRDESIISSTYPGNVYEQGLFKIDAGCCNAYAYHDTQHGIQFKDGNIITLQVAGNTRIRLGGDQYSGGTVTASSATGAFDIATQDHVTTVTYPQGTDGGPWVDFVYVGEAGTIDLTAAGSTSYLPYIELSPITYEVSLTQWVQKSGTVTINGTQIDFTSGADASSNATVSVSAGTVVSATDTEASILIDLGGNALSSFTPETTGDIASVSIDGNDLMLNLADDSTDPTSYIIHVSDNSVTVEAEPGETYSYNFFDGTEMPQTSYNTLRYSTFVTSDGILTINSNTEDEALQFGYHDSTHGGVFFPGNSFDMVVAGNAIITFIVDTYGSAEGATLEITDADQNFVGSIAAENIGLGDGFPSTFSYAGPAGVLTATLTSSEHPEAEIYIHGMSIQNEAAVTSNGKIDVWDFGAVQLNEEEYNNNLTEEIINGWYDEGITVGSSGNVFPSFSAGLLSWTGGGNDRLRTSNTNLTRYDENVSGVSEYTGRVYVNSTGATGRYMSITLAEDDEVTLMVLSQNAAGLMHFEYVADPEAQNDAQPITTSNSITELKFVAKEAGTYRVYDVQDKPSYYRIYRKDAVYATLSGDVDLSAAQGIPAEFQIVFTNEAGKTWHVSASNDSYEVDLPAGYDYEISLLNANGYIISSANTVTVTESTSLNIDIEEVILHEVSGAITGLGDQISNLILSYIPDPAADKIFVPEPVINVESATYTVQLEPNVEYTLEAEGVNDFEIPSNTLTITGAQTSDVVFQTKPTFVVSITAEGLTSEQIALVDLTFSNLHEPGYEYSFESVDGIALRNGTYSVSASGLDDYPLEQLLTSNVVVDGADITKEIPFGPVHNWSFDDQVITGETASYKGMKFTGGVSNEIAKGHLVGPAAGTIEIPVNAGEKVIITYYYAADFSIEGGEAITTNSGSTSTLETATYVYEGSEAGSVTLTVNATTYFTHIETAQVVPYAEVVTVGADKDYPSINSALDAVRSMDRPNDERVTIAIDPGNYEEMLVVDVANVSLKNASDNPTVGLANGGVDITDNAVRITSYYGHGYHYYSMGADQKWHADLLEVNKENGYYSHENRGAGTTDGSYWNSTVVVYSSGFEAHNIIFENSFNQYISKKESEDVVEEWANGPLGDRPTDQGNTAVQDRSFKERAGALALANDVDKVILNNCRVVGRQDTFYGGVGSRVAIYRGYVMGSVDFIYGGMTAVFYRTQLVMNTSDASNDVAYLTAAQQQGSERGYLMYECTVTSTTPGVETVSTTRSKPGYFGRPWQANTSEVVFYKTVIETTDYAGASNESLIEPEGWRNTLGGESAKMYEFGTIEESGVDNSSNRVSWATLLTEGILTDETEVTAFNFTRGNDSWDPFAGLLDTDADLLELSVAEGELTPAFSAEVTEYTVEVPAGTTAITVSATAASPSATVNVGTFATIPGSDQVVVTAGDGSTKEYTITVTVEGGVMSIDEATTALSIYPNPATDFAHIVLAQPVTGDLEIGIYNIQGELVKSIVKPQLQSGQQAIQLNVEDLSPGLYMVKAVSFDLILSQKLLIRK